jgi:GntR family transcriptional regulator
MSSKPLDIPMEDMAALESNSFVPLYVQLAERFACIIRASHESLVGAALPSEAECVDYFKISRPTVRQAMSELLRQGLIVRSRGKGTFVAPRPINHDLSHAFEDEMRVAQREVSFRLLDREIVPAPVEVANALQLAIGGAVERIRRLRILDKETFGFEERFVSADYAARITDEALGKKAIVSLIREFAGAAPSHFALTISSIPATKEYAKLLKCPVGAPLLSSKHTYFLKAQSPVLHGTVLFNGERYQFSVETAITSMDGDSFRM